MDIKSLTQQVEQIPDCASLSTFVVDILAQVADQRKLIEDEIADVLEEIAAAITPISYVAYKLKKAKEKLSRLNKLKQDFVDLLALAQVVQAKMNRLGCVNNLGETLKTEAESLAASITATVTTPQ